MPAVPIWDAPTQFDLTNPYNGSMSFNVQTDDGIYLLDKDNCSFDINVRETTDNIPQADGSIPHHRFLTGATVQLEISLWQDTSKIACDALLRAMVDNLSGAFRSLLNAGDNEGRLAWEIDGGLERMLDDVRLVVYPKFTAATIPIITVTIDSKYPYAQNLNQTSTDIADGDSAALSNSGTAEYFPVFQVQGTTSAFTITNETTEIQIEYNDGLPGAVAITSPHYAEIATFDNTIYLDGDGANLKAGVMELSSDYFSLVPGENVISIDGADMTVLWAPAWG